MSTKVFVTLQVPGEHRWPEATEKSKYHKHLANYHRHLFHIKVTVKVTGSNREIEFLEFQEIVWGTLAQLYPIRNGTNLHQFGHASCEQIAKNLLDALNVYQVEVSEDGENGAIVTQD